MQRTALATLFLSILILVLGASGLTGLSLEIGRIVLVAGLILSAVALGAQLAFGRHPTDVL